MEQRKVLEANVARQQKPFCAPVVIKMITYRKITRINIFLSKKKDENAKRKKFQRVDE